MCSDPNPQHLLKNIAVCKIVKSSVADPDPNPDPDPPDPHYLGLLDPDLDLLLLSKNSKKNLDFYCFVTSF